MDGFIPRFVINIMIYDNVNSYCCETNIAIILSPIESNFFNPIPIYIIGSIRVAARKKLSPIFSNPIFSTTFPDLGK